MRRLKVILMLSVVTALLAGVWVHAQPASSSDAITPDPVIQKELARVAGATNEDELQQALARLREIGGTDFSDLVPQLVLYLMNATDVREAMIPGIVVDRLQISPAQLRRALAPYAATNDARLTEQIRNLLHAPAPSSAPPVPSEGGTRQR